MQEPISSEETCDVFLSIAAPDRMRAEQLADLLEAQGWRVFLAHRSLAPGSNWPKMLLAALRKCRVVAVLLSEHSAQAHFQREEILRAIELSKLSGLPVVPVYLDGLPREPVDWDFGLRGFQWIDWRRADATGTATEISRVLGARAPFERRQEPHTIGDIFHCAALKIGRTKQWVTVLDICSSSESAFFLLHGSRQQNLDLFVSRIWHYLAQECGIYHRPYVVPLRVEFAKPRSAEAWENYLRIGLAPDGQGGGMAEELLRDAARRHPVFLVLSRMPIGSADLDAAEIEALEEFLRERLPALIDRAAAGRHPIRALLGIHYERRDESLADRLDESAYKGCRRYQIRYRRLPAVQALVWDDIEDFLDGLSPRPPTYVYRRLRAAFERLNQGNLQFRDVVELLSRELG